MPINSSDLDYGVLFDPVAPPASKDSCEAKITSSPIREPAQALFRWLARAGQVSQQGRTPKSAVCNRKFTLRRARPFIQALGSLPKPVAKSPVRRTASCSFHAKAPKRTGQCAPQATHELPMSPPTSHAKRRERCWCQPFKATLALCTFTGLPGSLLCAVDY